MAKSRARLGHVLSIVAMAVSLCLSVKGAYEAQVGWSCALFITMACLTEPSKLKANEIIWADRSRWHERLIALAWYSVCITLSVILLHMPVEQLHLQKQAEAEAARAARVDGERRAGEAQAAAEKRIASIKIEQRRVAGELAEARDRIQPSAPSAEKARAKFGDRMSSQERKVAELDLQAALENERLVIKVKRLEGELLEINKRLNLETEVSIVPRSEHPTDTSVPIVPNDTGVLNGSIYIFAFVLELTISLGIWSDGVYNKRQKENESLESGPATSENPWNDVNQSVEQTILPEKEFEMWLQLEWKKHRAADGWMATTQRGIAESHGAVSSGTVHRHLEYLLKTKKIEKRVTGRKTYIRFVEATTLKLVKG